MSRKGYNQSIQEASVTSDFSVASELRDFHAINAKIGLLTTIKSMTTPKWHKTALAFCMDWSLIFFSLWLVCQFSFYIFPLALLIVGSRQRAISNLVHEGSHWNLTKNKHINDRISDLFGALPLFKTTRFYRGNHLKHHAFLGKVNLDPDVDAHKGYGFNDFDFENNTLKRFLGVLFHPRSIKESVIGNLFKVGRSDRKLIFFWWGALLASMYLVFDAKVVFSFLALWFLSKLTVYNLIRNIVEFLDHSGLQPGSIMTYTRTISGLGPIRFLTHAHSNNFHLTHHLAPSVPWFHLKRLHQLFSNAHLDYRSAHHCTGLIGDNHSAATCWQGDCRRPSKRES